MLVTTEELQAAFHLLDSDQTGHITLQNLKRRLSVFFPEMTAKEYRFLMNNRKEITIEDLHDLLIDNEITNFDPVLDAFRAFDPRSHGHISSDKMREVFGKCGFGELSTEELDILMRSADLDGDGFIGVEDFRGMVDLGRPLSQHHDSHGHGHGQHEKEKSHGKGKDTDKGHKRGH